MNKPESTTVEGSGDQAALESLAEMSAKKDEGAAVAAPTRDDQALVEAASAGDHRAFETLVSKYERRIFAVALQLTRNGDLAQELTQEVFVRAWKALQSLPSTHKNFLSQLLSQVAISGQLQGHSENSPLILRDQGFKRSMISSRRCFHQGLVVPGRGCNCCSFVFFGRHFCQRLQGSLIT